MTDVDVWELIRAERTRVADVLEGLDPDQWQAQSLCGEWSVEQVAAHLTAAASTGTLAWIISIVRAGFDAGKHNARLVERYRGSDAAGTLRKYRAAIPLTTAPTKDYAALLGEVVVHGQDIARPLGVPLVPDARALVVVAEFFASKDFAVNSRTLVRGLHLEATDAPFSSGSGPAVRGPLLDLVMVMAGRPAYCAALSGEGVEELRRRLDRG